MRYLLIFIIFALVFISLCVQPDVQQAGMVIIDTGSPDIFIKAEAIPSEVRAGRNATFVFELRNKHDFDIYNIDLEVYDQCLFSGENKKSIEKLGPNQTKMWSWKWEAEEIYFDKDCSIKFKTEYEANFSLMRSIAVLRAAEYEQKELSGTLGDVSITSSSTDSPLSISLTFYENQPFLENEKNYIYLDYSNLGDGYIDVKNITINIPDNLQNIDCNDYTISENCEGTATACTEFEWDGTNGNCNDQQLGCEDPEDAEEGDSCVGDPTECESFTDNSLCIAQKGCRLSSIFSLNRKLNFINNRASKSTCSFIPKASQPVDIQTLMLTANYKYLFDNSMIVKVRVK